MRNHDHQNQPDSVCAVADTLLVAVLYDEASERERIEFDRHAAVCQSCRSELIAFGATRNQLGEYRENVVATLDAPEIALPHGENVFPATKIGWHNRLREWLFPAHNLWQTAAAVCAFLMFAALVSIVVVQQSGEFQIVQNRTDEQIAAPKPRVEKPANEQSKVEQSALNPAQQTPALIAAPAEKIASANSTANSGAAKSLSTADSRRRQRARRGTPSNVEAKPQRAAKLPAARFPADLNLTVEDAAPEDAAPRLTDLLEEIDSVG